MTDIPDGPGDGLTPEQLDALMKDTLGSTIPRPIRWADLDDTTTAKKLVELAKWVHWLGNRYVLDSRELPADWWRHGALVEELSALKGAWDVAYDQTQAASAAADWHMTFFNTRIRLKDWVGRLGGSPGERTIKPQGWLHDPDRSGWAAEFNAYLSSLTGLTRPD
ncbi:hypothetical protein [Jiangella sp. DSM 45060]|uniref:hypothetical protein n=1 Tax=Jiangella sp. DSM 45060 TaxID=1798224 RepID=UPI00087A655E|nr:hypothetical protein [Jiangella sp. DSM 45060]SDT36537.1 hypothetical protein SAMN04515669_3732 [Jiangella sp. DSM 45060]